MAPDQLKYKLPESVTNPRPAAASTPFAESLERTGMTHEDGVNLVHRAQRIVRYTLAGSLWGTQIVVVGLMASAMTKFDELDGESQTAVCVIRNTMVCGGFQSLTSFVQSGIGDLGVCRSALAFHRSPPLSLCLPPFCFHGPSTD